MRPSVDLRGLVSLLSEFFLKIIIIRANNTLT